MDLNESRAYSVLLQMIAFNGYKSFKHLTFSQTKILDCSKLKEFADDDFRFDENSRKFAKWVENTVEKGEIGRYEQFLLFPQCFQKTCIGDT